jgi:predicted protein tyrosine phosphatase
MLARRKKILVICSKNRWRSLTAERIYQNNPLAIVRSAGISPKARHKVSNRDIAWADIILCMERKHKEHLHRMFNNEELPEIIVANIPDEYSFMDEELCCLLKSEIDELLN